VNTLRRLLGWFQGEPSGPDPGEKAHTPRSEVERIATEWAEGNGKLMSRPLNVTFKVERGRAVWVVESNYGGKGHRIFVTVDDATAAVVAHDEILTR